MKTASAFSLLLLLLFSVPVFAFPIAEMTGGVYRLELTTFDCGGALTTGTVYWQYFAFGQTEGVGTLTELSGSTYGMDVGVLPQPVPEPALIYFALAMCYFVYSRK